MFAYKMKTLQRGSVFWITIAISLIWALLGGTVQAGNYILLNSFDSSSSNWRSYWWGIAGDVAIDRFYSVTWENSGGVGDTGYVWTDDIRWSIDWPDSNSILAFIKYQSWDGNPQLNLQNAVVSVYLRGEALDLKGRKLFFWILNAEQGARYHYTAYPLTISQGSWGVVQSFVLRNEEVLWFNSWQRNPYNIPTNLDYVLGHVDSYGFSFIGTPFSHEVTGRLMMDEFSITTQATPMLTWPNPTGIVYGTALGATQLNATASVPGTFEYTPPSGTLLEVGGNQSLGVVFTPTDATNYTGAAASAHITVYAAVHADFEASPLSGIVPLEVAFTNKTIGDWGVSEWDFGDGVTSTVANPGHTYDVPGVYTVTLKASGLGGTDTVIKTRYARVFRPDAGYFTATPTHGSVPMIVSFTSIIPVQYSQLEWNFADTNGFCGYARNPAMEEETSRL